MSISATAKPIVQREQTTESGTVGDFPTAASPRSYLTPDEVDKLMVAARARRVSDRSEAPPPLENRQLSRF